MREVDADGLALCSLQARVFEASADVLPACGSAVFVRRFMRSPQALRVDEWGAFDVGTDPARVVREINAEYGNATYGSEVYPSEVLHWMGYVYRYWCLTTGESSRHIYAIAGAREMRDLFYPYHALAPNQAVERILEAHGISTNANKLTDGVEVLRRLRASKAA